MQRYFNDEQLSPPDLYYSAGDWKNMSKRSIDLVYHTLGIMPIAVYAMGDKHVAVEVPAALTVKEC